MKNVFFVLFALILVSCGKKEEIEKESKSAPLKIEYSVQYPNPVYVRYFYAPTIAPTQEYQSDTSTTHSYTLNTTEKGGHEVNVWVWTYNPLDGEKVDGIGSGVIYHVKVTYNNHVLKDTTYNRVNNVSERFALPFID
jgi:hypothetical protein